MTAVLIISGSMGSGKTTVLGEASDLLTQARMVHAALDVDGFSGGFWPDCDAEMTYRTLATIASDFVAAGVTRLLIAEAIDSVSKRNRIRAATAATSFTVCRLRAALPTMKQRVRLREPGMLQEEFVARVATLDTAIDEAQVDDFVVDNDQRPITEVALEVLRRARWL